jgi:hypothetical protein
MIIFFDEDPFVDSKYFDGLSDSLENKIFFSLNENKDSIKNLKKI